VMSSYVATLVRVYLLDDHDIVRRGLCDLLAPARDIEVVGDSAFARSAAEPILRLKPDVMVLDLQLQDGSGIEVCRRVRSVDPSVRGLLLTSASDEDALVATLLAGAAGYVVKLAASLDIMGAIRRAGAGRELLDSSVRDRAKSLVNVRTAAISPPLTVTELDVLDQMIAGATDREIAERLGMPREELETATAALAHRVLHASPSTSRNARFAHEGD
jgi:two-component system response regulator DevR